MATTAALYPTVATQLTGTWATPNNATGPGTADYATWTSATSGAQASLGLSGFDWSSIPAGSTGISFSVAARIKVSDTVRVNSSTGTVFDSGFTALGAAQALTRATSDTTTTWTGATGLTYAQLNSGLYVEIKFGKITQSVSTVSSIDWVSITVTYTPPVANLATGQFFPFVN